jgi:hypothetical protein
MTLLTFSAKLDQQWWDQRVAMATRKRPRDEIDGTAAEKTPEDQQLEAITTLLRAITTKQVPISVRGKLLDLGMAIIKVAKEGDLDASMAMFEGIEQALLAPELITKFQPADHENDAEILEDTASKLMELGRLDELSSFKVSVAGPVPSVFNEIMKNNMHLLIATGETRR